MRLPWRHPLTLVGLYLLVSVPPYAALNWGIVTRIIDRSLPPTPLEVAVVVVGTMALLAGLLWASEGIDRYLQILATPSDFVSFLVLLSFFLAATSWWVVPEIAFEYFGRVELSTLQIIIFTVHVPMVLFLSFLTIAGIAHGTS